LRWLRRTIQLRRHLVASRLGNDCHTSTKKSSLSLKTRVNKKHLRATMLVVVQTIPRPCHEQALRQAIDDHPTSWKNQAGASWDEAWYVGLPYIIVLLINVHRSALEPGRTKIYRLIRDRQFCSKARGNWRRVKIKSTVVHASVQWTKSA
jgi:hypothetical protein